MQLKISQNAQWLINITILRQLKGIPANVDIRHDHLQIQRII